VASAKVSGKLTAISRHPHRFFMNALRNRRGAFAKIEARDAMYLPTESGECGRTDAFAVGKGWG
jgi:hypothetical protein